MQGYSHEGMAMSQARRTIRSLSVVLTPLVLIATLMLAQAPMDATASSHREAPLIAADPYVDNTDVYAFVSPDRDDTVTLLANFIPFQFPEGGPNWYWFDENAVYTINVDNVGDARPHIRYEFRFTNLPLRNAETFLYNTGPVTSLDDPDLNFRQTYSVTRVTQYGNGAAQTTVLGTNLPVPPVNIGPKSTPDYPALASAAIRQIGAGGSINVFAGPRDDSFFVDLGSVFDLLTLRPQPAPVGYASGSTRTGIDGLAGYNVHTIALQIPIAQLRAPGSEDPVIGVWSNTSRKKTRVLNTIADVFFNGAPGLNVQSGADVQVSRLGMPLVNEVVIPRALKDAFNTLTPEQDLVVFARQAPEIPQEVSDLLQKSVLDPELQRLLKALYNVPNPTADPPNQPRNDILSIFLTGMKTTKPFTIQTANGEVMLPADFNVNQPTPTGGVRPAEMIRLNTNIKGDLCKPDPDYELGLLGGDACGFPNGRRLADDVTDIELLAVAGAAYNVLTTGDEFDFNPALLGVLRDGVTRNDVRFLSTFPYAATPHQGADHNHANLFHLRMITVANVSPGGNLRHGGLRDE
jgi:hypothetical protein